MKNAVWPIAALCLALPALSQAQSPQPAQPNSASTAKPPEASQQAVQPAETGRRTMTAVRMNDNESVVMDGQLDEDVWTRAVPASGFIQVDPRNGAPATEQTDVRIVYNRSQRHLLDLR